MARVAKKKLNYDEEIMKIDSQITKHINAIAELKERKSELLSQKQHAELLELNNYLKSKNVNVSDLLKQLNAV